MPGFQWFDSYKDEMPLPKSLSELQPRMIQLWPEPNGTESLRVRIFGAHATGGRGEDLYMLEFIYPMPTNVPSPFATDPNAKRYYPGRKIIDGVYEVTGGS